MSLKLTDVVGAIRTKGDRATKAHERYRELLKRRMESKLKSGRRPPI